MRIIGFAGRSGAGKTAAAGMLAACLSEQRFSVKVDSFVGCLRDLAVRQFGSFDRDRDRAWMQETATAMRRQDADCFVANVIFRNGMEEVYCRHPPPADFLILPDVRFANEAELCRRLGVLVFIDGTHRAQPGDAARNQMTPAGTSPASLVSGLARVADYIIPRQPTLERLEAAVRAMIEVEGHLKRTE